MTAIAYIGLGSNLGDRRGYLERALQLLRGHPQIVVSKVSPFYETVPVGGPITQPNYLNGAAEIRTDLSPEELLRVLLDVEANLGRIRGEANAPRTIDLDVLFHGDTTRTSPDPVLPHPRLHERFFVLRPLADIAPDLRHPVLGVSMRELLSRLPAPAPIRTRELAGMRAVVTGSTSGIGFAIANEFLSAGADVVLHGRHHASGEAALRHIASDGLTAQLIMADLTDAAQCHHLVETAWDGKNGIDVWVNNAGADTLTGQAAHWPFERKLQHLLDVDVKATVFLAREVGRRMKQRGSGAIINMGWDQAETGMAGDSGQLFGLTKSAVMAFTKSLAITLAPEVRVNCLAPGWIRTTWGAAASEPWQDRVRRETPMGRWGTPEDVAAAARWLASPAASFVTGQIIRVNGGAVRS